MNGKDNGKFYYEGRREKIRKKIKLALNLTFESAEEIAFWTNLVRCAVGVLSRLQLQGHWGRDHSKLPRELFWRRLHGSSHLHLGTLVHLPGKFEQRQLSIRPHPHLRDNLQRGELWTTNQRLRQVPLIRWRHLAGSKSTLFWSRRYVNDYVNKSNLSTGFDWNHSSD